MRGSVYKRCQCRTADGKRLKSCRKQHGSWAYTIDAGKDTATGKRKQITRSRFPTKDKAQEEMTQELAALNAGTWTDDQGMTLATWLGIWQAEQSARGRSPKTLAAYRAHIRDVWIPRLGAVRLRDLRRGDVERVLADLNKPRSDGRPAGNSGTYVTQRRPGTVDAYRRTLRAALSVAHRRGLIAMNHAEGTMDAIPERHRGEEPELVVWEPEETARFLEHVSDDRLAALYELAAYAGMRRAELCGLRWSDIDQDGASLTVRQTIVELTRQQARPGDLVCPVCHQEHVGRVLKPPKSRKGRRWIPLAPPAQAGLAAHRELQQAERDDFATDYDDHGLVFCLIDGKPLRPPTVTKAFKEHVKACRLPVIRLHDMRHGACSLLLAGGVPIEIVQMILGHATPDITRRVYAHVMKKTTAALVETATRLLTRHRREQSLSK
jgi:integrase